MILRIPDTSYLTQPYHAAPRITSIVNDVPTLIIVIILVIMF